MQKIVPVLHIYVPLQSTLITSPLTDCKLPVAGVSQCMQHLYTQSPSLLCKSTSACRPKT